MTITKIKMIIRYMKRMEKYFESISHKITILSAEKIQNIIFTMQETFFHFLDLLKRILPI